MTKVETLIERLKDKDPKVRRDAAQALGVIPFAALEGERKARLGMTTVVMTMAMCFTLAFGIARNDARTAILGSIVIFWLGVFLCVAAWSWGRGDKRMRRAVQALLEALTTDQDEDVRCNSAWALGLHVSELQNDDTVFTQVSAILWAAEKNDPEPRVRSWAAWALSRIDTELSMTA